MTLEQVDPIEALLRRGTLTGTEAADDSRLVVSGNEVTVAIILAGKATLVEVAIRYGALLGTLGLVSEHVCFEVFVCLAAIRIGACCPLLALFIEYGAVIRDSLVRPSGADRVDRGISRRFGGHHG